MEEILSTSFNSMVSTYKKMLKHFYPARGRTGFTEVNQVHTFINSLMHSLNDKNAIAWLEFPWETKTQHIDGLVYSPKYQAIFYVEAKRLSITDNKKSIINDIKRIYHSNREFLQQNGIKKYNSEYIIALSDVWLEKRWKRSIPAWWCGSDRIPEQLRLWEHGTEQSLTSTKKTIHDDLMGINWQQSIPFAYWLGDECPNVKNYCLLMAALKI